MGGVRAWTRWVQSRRSRPRIVARTGPKDTRCLNDKNEVGVNQHAKDLAEQYGTKYDSGHIVGHQFGGSLEPSRPRRMYQRVTAEDRLTRERLI